MGTSAMETLQQTFSGELIRPERVREIRYTPPVPVHRYYVEFYSGDLDDIVVEFVRIEDREIAGISAYDRAVYAATHNCCHKDLETIRFKQMQEVSNVPTSEIAVEAFFRGFEDDLAMQLREDRLNG